jgi:H+/gluconate symporter-like permease
MGLFGILLGLALLIWLAFRGWSVLLLAPVAALLAAAAAGEPLLAHWTQTFMAGAARFLAQFFPLFLLGALFGKLMEDSGSVSAIASAMTTRLGPRRAVLGVVLAGAIVTYGGVSLFVAFFVLAPMAQALFRAADIPHRLMPAAIALGTSAFTMSALPGTPALQNAIPMPFFGTTPFAAPGLGIIAAAIMLGFGLWSLRRAEAAAHGAGEGYGRDRSRPPQRNRAARARGRLAVGRGHRCQFPHGDGPAATPRHLPPGGGALGHHVAAGGRWRVGGGGALAAAILTLIVVNRRRLPALRQSMDAGANASVLPAVSVASLVGFGAVVAALPAFAMVREAVLSIGGGPLVSLAAATNVSPR